MIFYFCPQSNNKYSHNKILFLTIPKFIRKKTYLFAPENFTSEANVHSFFQLKKNINLKPSSNKILIKIFRLVNFIYLSICNTYILYKIIRKTNSKNITLVVDGYNSFDILFIPLIIFRTLWNERR